MNQYAPYNPPSIAGITMASGSFTQQPIYDGVLSYEADARNYAQSIGAKLVNALQTPATNFTFSGIKPADVAQPWMVTWDGIQFFFCGIAIKQQAAASKAVSGVATTAYPGSWKREPSGVWDFVPEPPQASVPTPVVSHPDDVAGWLAAMNAPTVTLNDVMKALASIALAVGAKAPSA